MIIAIITNYMVDKSAALNHFWPELPPGGLYFCKDLQHWTSTNIHRPVSSVHLGFVAVLAKNSFVGTSQMRVLVIFMTSK
jgi:hypothetical protein